MRPDPAIPRGRSPEGVGVSSFSWDIDRTGWQSLMDPMDKFWTFEAMENGGVTPPPTGADLMEANQSMESPTGRETIESEDFVRLVNRTTLG